MLAHNQLTMKVVALDNEDQANQLRGQQYADGKFFNPIPDADGEWIISITERDEYLELSQDVQNKDFIFILGCAEKDHNPIIEEE